VSCRSLVILGACTTSQSGAPASSLLRSGWMPAPEQTCQLLTTPSVLPEANRVLDVTSARAVMAAAASNGSPAYAVLEVRFDSAGALQPVRLLESTVSPEVAEALLRSVVTDAPGGAGEDGRGWGVLVRADAQGEGADAFRVERMEYCACSLINRREFARLLGSAAQRVRTPALAGTRQQFTIDVRSDSAGNILEKRLHRPTGYVEVDRMAVQLADRMRVAPPLLNRRPLEAWSRIPVTVSFPAPAKPGS
jgi:hypothetical protein